MAELTADIVTAANPVVDGPMLDALEAAHRAVDATRLDSAPAVAFRHAAVRLAREVPQTDGANQAARDAAKALMGLAAAKDEGALRQVLRPDPQELETTWTVACYQIGDLTPCALLDFANPVAAVVGLASCGESSHVAAELVASTPEGTRWTALTRTGRSVRFQLPSHRSASDTTGEVLGELSLAAEHWRTQLLHWAADPDDAAPTTVATPTVVTPSIAATVSPPADQIWAPSEVARPAPAGSGELERALELVLATLRSLEVQGRGTERPSAEVLTRLDALERHMTQFQTAMQSALDQRIQALATYGAELTRSFAAQQNTTLARIEARIDQLASRFPTAPTPDPAAAAAPAGVGVAVDVGADVEAARLVESGGIAQAHGAAEAANAAESGDAAETAPVEEASGPADAGGAVESGESAGITDAGDRPEAATAAESGDAAGPGPADTGPVDEPGGAVELGDRAEAGGSAEGSEVAVAEVSEVAESDNTTESGGDDAPSGNGAKSGAGRTGGGRGRRSRGGRRA